MSQLKLIAGAWLIEGLRRARANLYALLVLTPLVLGMTYYGVGRMVRESEWSPSEAQLVALSAAAAACLVALSMSRASAEIYHTRSPESVFDALPVSADAQLSASLARRFCRTLAAGAAAVVLRWLEDGAFDAATLAYVLLFVSVASSGEVLSALGWIHFARVRGRAQATASLLLFVASAATGGLLLAEVLRPVGLSFVGRASLLACGASLTAASVVLAFALHRRWRAADAEFAKRLGERERWGSLTERLARRVCGGARKTQETGSAPAYDEGAVAAQLARDLQLTLRGFSSAVYASAGVAALVLAALVAALTGGGLPVWRAAGWLTATWLPRVLAVKTACVVASASLASIVPVLVAHQQPHLWLERAVGVKGEDAWRAKLYLARVITLPAPVAAWVIGLSCGGVPAVYALPLLAECLWLWWLVATLAGGLAYEMPGQPGLALILVLCATLAAGGLAAFAWPLGLAIYAQGAQRLYVRGTLCARQHIKGEGA